LSDDGKYRTIVADPPWRVNTGPSWGKGDKSAPLNERSHALSYQTLTVAEIAEMPVASFAADGCHLYLWTINKYVEDAYRVARGWGFTPSTLLTWCKPPKGIGLGGAYALATEHVLFARHGSCAALTRVDRNWWEWPRRRHSQKPEAFQDLVEQVSPGPYLELFARRKRLGWDVWGNEVESDVDLAA
jgi:N6-adenosine-specific RNA methylase IME4